MKKFADKAIVYMGSSFLDSFLQIVIGMLMVRYMTKYDYGTFRQVMLIAVLVTSSIAVGLPESLSYFIPRASTAKEKKQLAFQVFMVLIGMGFAAALACWMLGDFISASFNNPDLKNYTLVFSLFFLFLLPGKCTQTTLIALGRTNMASMLNTGVALFNFFCVLIPLVMRKDLKTILFSMLAVYMLQFLILVYVFATLEGGMPRFFDLPMLKKQMGYGLPLGGSVMIGTARRYIDQFIVATFYNPVNFAVYSRGAFELPFVAILPYALSSLMIPRISEYHAAGNRAGILHLWSESMWKVSLLFFPLFVFAFMFAEQIVTLLFTAEYLECVTIFRIYLLLLPVRIASYRTILQATGQTRPILTGVTVSLAVSAALGILLERSLGISGPAYAVVLGELSGCGYMLWKTSVHADIRLSELIKVGQLVKPLLCAAGVGIVVYPLKYIDVPALSMLLAGTLVYFGGYVFAMRVFRFFTASDWDLISRWVTLRAIRGG